MMTPDELDKAEAAYHTAAQQAIFTLCGDEGVRLEAARVIAEAIGRMRRLIETVRELQSQAAQLPTEEYTARLNVADLVNRITALEAQFAPPKGTTP